MMYLFVLIVVNMSLWLDDQISVLQTYSMILLLPEDTEMPLRYK